jgi:hypothetical protein
VCALDGVAQDHEDLGVRARRADAGCAGGVPEVRDARLAPDPVVAPGREQLRYAEVSFTAGLSGVIASEK